MLWKNSDIWVYGNNAKIMISIRIFFANIMILIDPCEKRFSLTDSEVRAPVTFGSWGQFWVPGP